MLSVNPHLLANATANATANAIANANANPNTTPPNLSHLAESTHKGSG